VRQSQDHSGFPAVGFDIRSDRGTKFGEFTEEHIGNQMAIVINDEIVTFPNIEDELPGGGIINGGARGFRTEEVQDLIQILKSGSLKISPKFESEESVGATLGSDYVRRGTISSVVAMIAVVLFGMWYYRALGVITGISLVVNLLLLLGAMRLLQTTLTLPGVAGIVLTIGMAIDANILIFERMREGAAQGPQGGPGGEGRLRERPLDHPRREHHDVHHGV
jgi:protein-export membrane protein SecD